MIANITEPPYYAETINSIRTDGDNGYSEMADLMEWYKSFKTRIARVEKDYELD